jgi:hypothetical protein
MNKNFKNEISFVGFIGKAFPSKKFFALFTITFILNVFVVSTFHSQLIIKVACGGSNLFLFKFFKNINFFTSIKFYFIDLVLFGLNGILLFK